MSKLVRTLQGGLVGATAGMFIGYMLTGNDDNKEVSLPFDVPNVQNDSEALNLCLNLGDFRAFGNENFAVVCKNMDKLLEFEKLVNDTSKPLDAAVQKEAFSAVFSIKESLKNVKVSSDKMEDFENLKESFTKYVDDKKHNIMLGASLRISEDYLLKDQQEDNENK